jgi:hypothetical protein
MCRRAVRKETTMAIPIGNVHTATAQGTLPKVVKCEQCGQVYFYLLQRQGTGSKFSPLFLNETGAADRALVAAQVDLARQLESEVDPVPCPACGWYQRDMIPVLRAAYGSWMSGTGWILFLATIPMTIGFVVASDDRAGPWKPGILALSFGVLAILCLAGSFAMAFAFFVVRPVLARWFDPNAAPVEERLRRGSERAFLPDSEATLSRQVPLPPRCSAAQLFIRVERLCASNAGWPEILSVLNAEADPEMGRLLSEVRDLHSDAPEKALGLIEAGCRRILIRGPGADAVSALQVVIDGIRMQFRVFGHDEQSGAPVDPFVIQADGEAEARAQAAELGVVVEKIESAFPAHNPKSGGNGQRDIQE